MPITLKCPDCGHTKASDDGEPETCPQCEGTMAPPAKKKYQAKSTSLEDEEKAKKKSKPRDDDAPRPKKKPRALVGEDGGAPDAATDGAAAASLEIDPGFTNKKLMRQVAEELESGEVVHWAGRMCPEIVANKAFWARIGGLTLTVVGVVFSGVVFAVAPWFVGLIPLIFVAVGIGITILGPGVVRKAGENSWYAVTDRRAIVYTASGFGSGGSATGYEPNELRRMRVKAVKSPKGAGDLIFKTKITETRTDYVDKRGHTVRSETNQTEQHFGFLGIPDVREVETLIQNVLLGGARGEDDEDEE